MAAPCLEDLVLKPSRLQVAAGTPGAQGRSLRFPVAGGAREQGWSVGPALKALRGACGAAGVRVCESVCVGVHVSVHVTVCAQVCVHVCACVCVTVCTRVSRSVCACVHACVHNCVHACVPERVCTGVWVHAGVCACVCTCLCVRVPEREPAGTVGGSVPNFRPQDVNPRVPAKARHTQTGGHAKAADRPGSPGQHRCCRHPRDNLRDGPRCGRGKVQGLRGDHRTPCGTHCGRSERAAHRGGRETGGGGRCPCQGGCALSDPSALVTWRRRQDQHRVPAAETPGGTAWPAPRPSMSPPTSVASLPPRDAWTPSLLQSSLLGSRSLLVARGRQESDVRFLIPTPYFISEDFYLFA